MDDNYNAWRHALAGFGIAIKKEDYFLMEGLNTRNVAKAFLEEGGIGHLNGKIDEIVAAKERFYMENNNFELYEGVDSYLSELKENEYPIGLVSGGSYSRILETTSRRFLSRFDVIVSGDSVRNCKPHPEPYLRAAEGLRMDPADCLAVENAPIGIESAKRAGMYCIAISSTLAGEHLSEADRIVARFGDLGKLYPGEKTTKGEGKE